MGPYGKDLALQFGSPVNSPAIQRDQFIDIHLIRVRIETVQTDYNHALHVDLGFLHSVGVLGAARHRELDALADRITPAAVWIGYDCTDAIQKNFVICPNGRVRGIDIESLGARVLIGSGAAKASIRWLGSDREFFFEALAKHSQLELRRSLRQR